MALADATVRVILDVTRFDRDLQTKVASAARRAGRTFESEFTKTARSTGSRWAREFREQASQSLAGAGTVAGRQFGTGVRNAARPTGRLTGRELGEQIRGGLLSTTMLTGRQFARGLLSNSITEAGSRLGQRLGRTIGDNLNVEGVGSRLRQEVEDDAEPHMLAAARTVAARFASALGSAISGISIGRFGLLVGAVTGLVSEGTQLAAALAPALQAIGLIPGAMAIAAAGVSTLVVAFQGMGDALQAAASGDAEKLAEAMKNLAPAAQGVVTEFARLSPRLREVRTQVQQAFFAQLTGDITRLGQALIGPVQRGMTGTATAAGRMASGLAEVIAQARNADVIQRVFEATARLFDRMTVPLERMTQGMFDWVGATLPAFDRIGQALGEATNRFADFLSVSARSGQAMAWVNEAITTLSQLWQVAKNLTGVLGAIFSAANEASGGYLVTLNRALASTREFLSAGAGRAALVETFRGLHQVVAALGSPLREVVVQLGTVARVAGDVAQALSSGVTAAIRGIGQGIGNAGPALTRFADGISRLLSDIAPSLATLGSAFGRLLDAVTPLGAVIGVIVRAGIGLINLFSQLPTGVLTAVAAFVALRALGVPDLLSNIAARGQQLYASFQSGNGALSQMASTYQSTLAQLTAFRVQQQFLANTMTAGIPAVGGFSGAIGGLVDRASAAGSALRVGLSGALSGLVGMLGGPLGIALMGASVLIGILASAHQDAAQAAKEQRDYIIQLAQSLDKQSGAITQNTLETVRNKAEKDGLLKTARDLGVNTSNFIGALAGEANATRLTNDELRNKARSIVENSDAYKMLIRNGFDANQALHALTEAAVGNRTEFDRLFKSGVDLGENGKDLAAINRDLAFEAIAGTKGFQDLGGAVGKSGGEMSEARKQFADFQKAVRDSVQNSTLFGQALQKMADTAASAEEKTRALREALRALEGGTQSVTEAQVAQYDALRGIDERIAAINQEYGKGAGRAKEFGQSLFDSNGQIVASSKGVSELTRSARDLNDRLADVSSAAADQARRTGDWASAQRTITDAYNANRQALVNLAQSMGFSAQEAQRFADMMLRTPQQVQTTLSLVGAPQALQQLGEVQLLLSKLQPGQPKIIYMRALTDEAKKALEQLGFTVERLPSGEFKVTAKTDEAIRALEGLKVSIDQTTGTIKLEATNDQAKAKIGEIGKLLTASATANVELNGARAYATVDGLMVYINDQTGQIRVGALPQDAQDKTKALQDFINAQNASIGVTANTAPAQSQLSLLLDQLLTPGQPQITPGVNPGPAQQQLNGLIFPLPLGTPQITPGVNPNPAERQLNGLTAPLPPGTPQITPGVNGKGVQSWFDYYLQNVVPPPGQPQITPGVNPGPARDQLNGLTLPLPLGTPQVTPSANTAPARAQINGFVAIVNATQTTGPIVNANTGPGQAQFVGLVNRINTTWGNVNVGANTGPGYGSVNALVGWVAGRGASVGVGANTGGAYGAVDALVRYINSRVATITVRTSNQGDIRAAAGGVFKYFGNGGFNSMRPMPANRAEIVPPGVERVIGDRARGDEAFIPLVNTARSHAIMRTAAARMGYDLTPRSQRPVQTHTTNVEAGAIVVNAPQSDPYLVARSVVNQLVREAVI